MADSIIIPNAKQVAKKSATLWTGYIGLLTVLVDLAYKFVTSDASAGMSENTRMYVLATTTALGIVLRFWDQKLHPTTQTTKE